MTNGNRALIALSQLAKSLPDGSNIEVRIAYDVKNYVCHKFRVTDGAAHHSESHSSDFVEHGGGQVRAGRSKLLWP